MSGLVSFSPFSMNTESDCEICGGSLREGEVVAHNEGGERHPIHYKCIEEWAKINNTCPFCRREIDQSSLLSWKQRVITSLLPYKAIIVAKLIGATMGTGIVAVGGLVGTELLEAAFRADVQALATLAAALAALAVVATLLVGAGREAGIELAAGPAAIGVVEGVVVTAGAAGVAGPAGALGVLYAALIILDLAILL